MSSNAPFSRGAIIALVMGGFALFLALLFLLGRGEAPLADTQNGGAHAAANGLTGYAGFARLLAASDYRIARSRSPAGLETANILVLTPPLGSDPEAIGALLTKRRTIGPTLVILPKWRASLPPGNLPREAATTFKRGWVVLGGAEAPSWPGELPAPFALTPVVEQLDADETPGWKGLGLSGDLPTRMVAYADKNPLHEVLIADAADHPLAVRLRNQPGSAAGGRAHDVIFLVEPDLANNYGLADPARAAAAIALVRKLEYTGMRQITFDLTLHGFGGSDNLLTLAFRPPFLAATLCLVMALIIVFWRAMLRFGPAAVHAPAGAFGKRQLVENGAGLILRARRWRLLAAPYARLAERRLARELRLARHDPASLDAALAQRAPLEEPFSSRAARLEAATTPADILSAAAALDTLPRKLTR